MKVRDIDHPIVTDCSSRYRDEGAGFSEREEPGVCIATFGEEDFESKEVDGDLHIVHRHGDVEPVIFHKNDDGTGYFAHRHDRQIRVYRDRHRDDRHREDDRCDRRTRDAAGQIGAGMASGRLSSRPDILRAIETDSQQRAQEMQRILRR